MAAVLRVKRHLEEDPLDALVLCCKRFKADSEQENVGTNTSTVVRFAGTFEKNEDILSHLKKSTKEELQEQFKKHEVDLTSKLRTQKFKESKESRFKVVNFSRSQHFSSDCHELTVLDIEADIVKTCDEVDAGYVFDMYYSNVENDAVLLEDPSNLMGYFVTFPPDEPVLVNQEFDEDSDSEDSNAENYYQNDYPDESDHDEDSICEEDMIAAVNRLDIADLSSDESYYNADKSDESCDGNESVDSDCEDALECFD